MKAKTILFDLDGTIIDSFPGITKCVQYALASQGVTVKDAQVLRPFIGPPLSYSFQTYYGFDDATTEELIRKYRERFDVVGIFENTLYPGVPEALRRLKEDGYRLALASSKPEVACRRILEHHQLLPFFDEVVGASLDGSISEKQEVLREAMRRLGVSDPSKVFLIGDTVFDIRGANEVGIPCIGVSYGFGQASDLQKAGAVCVLGDLKEVVEYIEGYQSE